METAVKILKILPTKEIFVFVDSQLGEPKPSHDGKIVIFHENMVPGNITNYGQALGFFNPERLVLQHRSFSHETKKQIDQGKCFVVTSLLLSYSVMRGMPTNTPWWNAAFYLNKWLHEKLKIERTHGEYDRDVILVLAAHYGLTEGEKPKTSSLGWSKGELPFEAEDFIEKLDEQHFKVFLEAFRQLFERFYLCTRYRNRQETLWNDMVADFEGRSHVVHEKDIIEGGWQQFFPQNEMIANVLWRIAAFQLAHTLGNYAGD